MRTIGYAALVMMSCGAAAQAQTPATVAASAQPVAANPKDVESLDAILAALYGVISGDKGVKRDWNRFRSLFHPDGKLVPTGANKVGMVGARFISPDQYVASSGSYVEEMGFHEVEIARRVETFGHVTHVFSTYAGRHALSDPEPFLRGINSIQLLNDGKRWWVLNIAWSQESAEFPIPAEYLPKR